MYGLDAQPRPGDFSVCLNCGQVLRFTENLHSRTSDLLEAFINLDWQSYELLMRSSNTIRWKKR
jgi:hypothetical protein